MKKRVFLALFFGIVFLGVMPTSRASAQTFSFGVDAPLVGAVNGGQMAVGVGLSIGLVHIGPIRLSAGLGFVDYPKRPIGREIVKSVEAASRPYVTVIEVKDDKDLVFTTSVGFRVREVDTELPAIYFTLSYMRALTAEELPGLGKINHGVLFGLTFASR